MNIPEFRAEMARHAATQETVAGIIGITPTALRNKMRGKSDFKAKEITQIRNAFKLTPEQIDRIFFEN